MAKNTQEVRIRRSAKFLPFMITGAVLGVIAAVVVGLSIPEEQRTAQPIITYLIAYFAGIGFVIGIVVALILERIFVSRAKRAEATKL
ncbi:hypothetical protein [Candidatus Rhodoluna planktonica]|uniref:Uncharacterized protein n=1 Tax=Candidatus Rhodoluna planktonica TaxID=535712 RepID=A0A1D9DXL3_9MICO|nr:hypothetical protein [Candidatus Rhodoluna planktonica]AOY55547.1 hypothetical protein A4Z71_00550 [Candidatus Rhodoluna planktonica]